MKFDYDSEVLPPELRTAIALQTNYKDLINFCKTSKRTFEEIFKSNIFWKQKTFYDFKDLYDIEEFEGNWWNVYQYYRAVFTLDLIEEIKERNPKEAGRLLRINEKRQFLMVNGHDEKGDTALITAARKDYEYTVSMLLEAGADSEVTDEGGNTALIVASRWGHPNIVKMLLDNGADSDLKNNARNTALIEASRWGHPNIVKMLLDNGADPDIADAEENTALIEASIKGRADIISMLLKAGADPDLKNKFRETALILASFTDRGNIVSMLLKAGVDTEVMDDEGNTAFEVAFQNGHTKTLRILKRYYES